MQAALSATGPDGFAFANRLGTRGQADGVGR